MKLHSKRGVLYLLSLTAGERFVSLTCVKSLQCVKSLSSCYPCARKERTYTQLARAAVKIVFTAHFFFFFFLCTKIHFISFPLHHEPLHIFSSAPPTTSYLSSVSLPDSYLSSDAAINTVPDRRHAAGWPLLTDKKLSNLPPLQNKCGICTENLDLAIHSPHLLIFAAKHGCVKHVQEGSLSLVVVFFPFCKRKVLDVYGSFSRWEAEAQAILEAARVAADQPGSSRWGGWMV